MNDAEQIRILAAAQGDPAALALALVDLTFHDQSTDDRTALRRALEAAAIPHWVTPSMLAVLIETHEERAASLLARLRQLTVVEPFPARGEGACNVHEQARLALRSRLAQAEPARLRELSTRAAKALEGNETPAGGIERTFHLIFAEPARGEKMLVQLSDQWMARGRIEERQALAATCEEMHASSFLAPECRAVIALTLAGLREHHLPVEKRLPLLREAITIFGQNSDPLRMALAMVKFGEALGTDAASQSAAAPMPPKPYPAPCTAEVLRQLIPVAMKTDSIRRASRGPDQARQSCVNNLEIARQRAAHEPDNPRRQRDLCAATEWLGSLESTQGRGEQACEAYLVSLEIRRRLAALDPDNTTWQRDLDCCLNNLGRLLLGEGRAQEAIALLTEAGEISAKLVALDPDNTLWQAGLNADRHWLSVARTALAGGESSS